MIKIDHNYLKHRKYSYFELLAFATLVNSNPGIDHDQILVDMMRLELLEHSTEINEQLIEMMLNVVSKYYGLSVAEIKGGLRTRELVRARQIFCYWAVKSMHQFEVAKYSQMKRDSVHARKQKCAVYMETEPDFANECAEIGQQIDVLRLGIQFKIVRKFSPDPTKDLAIINTKNQKNDEN
jgi:hypothetical protein